MTHASTDKRWVHAQNYKNTALKQSVSKTDSDFIDLTKVAVDPEVKDVNKTESVGSISPVHGHALL